MMLIFIFLIFVLNFLRAEQIPVLMWETNQELNLTSNKFSPFSVEHDFKAIISETFKKKIPIIVFLEETLNLEDLIIRNEYGSTIFPGLSILTNSLNSYFMPYVDNPVELIEEITSPVKKIDSISLYDWNTWNEAGAIIVDLNSLKSDDSRKNMLKKHDFTIFQIHSIISNKYNRVLNIFTARYSSWMIPEYSQRHYFKKLLQSEPTSAAPDSKVTPIVDDKNLLLVISGESEYSNDNGAKFSPVTLSRSDFSIKDNEMSLSLDAGSVKVVFSISLDTDGFWKINNITMGEKTVEFEEIEVPFNFSYHCSNFELSNIETKQILRIAGFQIQPFKDEQDQQQFGSAYDCVGFVTIPIASGIFVCSILFLILFCGILCVMDIETTDRFDDPNAKAFKAFVEYG